MIGLYIHIPFCKRKCGYCDFYSKVENNSTMADYAKAVAAAIKNQPFGKQGVDTMYFGGGTPNLLGGDNLKIIVDTAKESFDFSETSEITLEANPESTNLQLLENLLEIGFNRISFGVQSSNAKELKAMEREHTTKEAEDIILAAKKAGFKHISADLMLGVPYQTAESMEESINFLTSLPLDHISAYMLKIEEETPFYRKKMERFCPDEQEVIEYYLKTVRKLEEAGFMQYEISNFARAEGQSLHNLKYWNTQPYLGVGPSAHSFMKGKRFATPSDTKGFIFSKGDWSKVIQDGKGGDFAEYAMLKLRLKPGLNLLEAKEIYPDIGMEKILAEGKSMEEEGLAVVENNTITFTPEGFLLSNFLIAQLLF